MKILILPIIAILFFCCWPLMAKERIELYAMGKTTKTPIPVDILRIKSIQNIFHTTIVSPEKIEKFKTILNKFDRADTVSFYRANIRLLLELHVDNKYYTLTISDNDFITLNESKVFEYNSKDLINLLQNFLPPSLSWYEFNVDIYHKLRYNTKKDILEYNNVDGYNVELNINPKDILKEQLDSLLSLEELEKLHSYYSLRIDFGFYTKTNSIYNLTVKEFTIFENNSIQEIDGGISEKITELLLSNLKVISIHNAFNKDIDIVYRSILIETVYSKKKKRRKKN